MPKGGVRSGRRGRATLRIALFVTIEPVATDVGRPRAFLSVAGRAVVQHQLDLALALDCRRIVCLFAGPEDELAPIRHRAEQAGSSFHALREAQGLYPLVAANDELLVFADGLLAEPIEALKLLQSEPGVLVQPVEEGIAAGFERLDINRASGGILLAPAKLVARLAELPGDYDPVSALTRIALQSGVPMREIPEVARRGGRWTIVRDEPEAQRLDARWIALNLGNDPDATPSQALARIAVSSFGSSLLHAGSSSRMLAAGTGLLLLVALGAGWLGATATAFVFAALGCMLGQGAMMLMRVEQGALEPQGTAFVLGGSLSVLVDVVLVLLIAWPARQFVDATLLDRMFPALVLVGLLRLVPRLFGRRYARWLRDRVAIALILAIATLGGLTMAAAEVIGLGLLAGAIAQGAISRQRKIAE
jgi:hypothetical protein